MFDPVFELREDFSETNVEDMSQFIVFEGSRYRNCLKARLEKCLTNSFEMATSSELTALDKAARRFMFRGPSPGFRFT